MTDLPELPQRPVRIESVDLDGDELLAVLGGEGAAIPLGIPRYDALPPHQEQLQ